MQYSQYAVSLATKLTELGVEKGDVVAVGSEKRLELYPTLLAVALSGAAYTSYELQNGRSSLKHKLSLAQPNYFICSKFFFERYSDTLLSCSHIKKFISLDDGIECHYSIKNLKLYIDDIEKFTPVDVEGQTDTAIILCSSGTTGMPKGVCLSHLNSILNSLSMEPTFADESLKTVLLSGTVHHNYHHFMLYKFLSLGRKVVYPNEFTIENVIACVEKYQINIAMIYPVQAYTCSKIDNVDIHKYNLDSLKIFYCRSSPLHPRVISELKKRYPNLKSVMQGYGMSEHGEVTSESWSSKGLKPGSVGMASPGLILKIVQLETNKKLGPSEKGEIRIKGPALMKGYIESILRNIWMKTVFSRLET